MFAMVIKLLRLNIITMPTMALMFIAFATGFSASAAPNTSSPGTDAWLRNIAHELQTIGAVVDLGQVDYDSKRDAFRSPGTTITFPTVFGAAVPLVLKSGTLSVQGLSDGSKDLTLVQLRIDDVQASFAGYGLTIKTINLNNAILAHIGNRTVDAGHPVEALVALVGDCLKSQVKELWLEGFSYKTPTPGSALSFDRLLVHDVLNGTIGKIELSGLVSEDAAAQRKISLAQVALEEFSPRILFNLIDPDSYKDPLATRPWTPVVKRGTANGLDIIAGNSHTLMESVELGSIEIRRLPFDPLPILDIAATSPTKLPEHSGEIRQFAEALLGVGRIVQAGIHHVSSEATDKDQKRRTSADVVNISGLEPRRTASLQVDNFQITANDGGLRAAHLTLENFALPNDPGTQVRGQPIPTFTLVSIDDGVIVRPGLNLAVNSLRIEASDHIGYLPTRVSLVLTGLSVPVTDVGNPTLTGTLTDLGLTKLQVDAALSGGWSQASEKLDLENFQLTVADLGQLAAAGSLSNIPRDAIEHPETFGSAVMAGNLVKAELGFVDNGLVDRVFTKLAALNKVPSENIKKSITINMPVLLGQVSDSAVRNRMIFAAIEFLNTPKNIKLYTTLTSPLPISTLMATLHEKPQNLPGLLKLDAAANRKP